MSLRTHMLRHGSRTGVLAASIGALIASGGLSGKAFAQEEEEAEDEAPQVEEDDEEQVRDEDVIIVTGTRIRRDDFTSPNSMSVVTGDDMRALGVISVADMVAQLPNNVASRGPQTNTDSAFFLGASIANLRGLNTFYGTRTLTLVDSRRVVASNSGGSVDLNLIPSALVGRIETVTGGASATYGSDALAGVVNVIVDRNIDNIRVDLAYSQTAEGDRDHYNFSMATGQEFFEGRGRFQVGLEYSNKDGIDDCTTREYCQKSRGIIQNGTCVASGGGFFPPPCVPYDTRNTSVSEPDQPQFIIAEGLRYAVLPGGVMWPTDTGGVGYLGFNDAGDDVVSLYQGYPAEWVQYIDSEGVFGDTPYGTGALSWKGVPVEAANTRQNIYTSFEYELEGGITLDASMTFAETMNTALQDSTRFSLATISLHTDNAYWQLGSPAMQAELNSRIGLVPTFDACYGAPYLGGSFSGTRPPDGYDCASISKDWSDQIDRRNDTDSDSLNLNFGARGALIEGSSWTWDLDVGWGETDSSSRVQDYPSSNRQTMALDAVLETDGVTPVCRIHHSAMGPADRQRWIEFVADGLNTEGNIGDDDSAYFPEAAEFVDALAQGCEPLSPFGFAMSPEARAYAFPAINEGTTISQETMSFVLSGDISGGIGAGPMRMAVGIDWRDQETDNYSSDDPLFARDFFLNYGSDYQGNQANTDAFIEFDLPLIADKPGVDSFTVNASFRRNKNENNQTTPDDPRSATSYNESWKGTLAWRPIDIMMVRMTRSVDTRGPSARELFGRNSPSLQGGTFREINNDFFRENIPPTGPGTVNESYETYLPEITAGNPDLGSERSITETLGLVFTPSGSLEGLSVSVDYYETIVKGGIEEIGGMTVLNRCENEITIGLPLEYCNLIEFGEPDPLYDPTQGGYYAPDDPRIPYTNIEVLRGAQENVAPFWNRGFDLSVSYATQLAGGGSLNARVLGTRYLEQSIDLGGWFPRTNVAGQTGANVGGSFGSSFGVNYSPVPNMSANAFLTYTRNAFSVTSQIQYIGTGRLNNQDGWIGPDEVGWYTDQLTGLPVGPFPYDATIDRTVTDSTLPSWTTLTMNFNYDFGRSRFNFDRFESMSVYLNIDNVGDRVPNFFSGNAGGGVNTTFFDPIGRSYRMGVRMEF